MCPLESGCSHVAADAVKNVAGDVLDKVAADPCMVAKLIAEGAALGALSAIESEVRALPMRTSCRAFACVCWLAGACAPCALLILHSFTCLTFSC